MKKLPLLLSHALLACLCFFSFDAKAQISWPPTTPTLSDISIGTASNVEWVNCDMYQYTPGSSTDYLFAMVYDDVVNDVVNLVVYDVASGTYLNQVIEDAQHADIVIVKECYGYVAYAGQPSVMLIYEEPSTGKFIIREFIIDLSTSPMTILTSTYVPSPVFGQNPHIDLLTPIDPFLPGVANFVATWDYNGQVFATNWNSGTSLHFWTSSCLANYAKLIDDGIMPDVAYSFDPNTGYRRAYFIYYDPVNNQVKHADWEPYQCGIPPTLFLNTYPPLETGIVTAPPRIEAPNLSCNPSNTVWKAVVEITGESSSNTEIHGYDYTNGSYTVTNYSSIAVTGGNPLSGNDGYGPAVCIGNGPNTLTGMPSDVGNDGYTVGWNINNRELEALYLDEANVANVQSGYDMINSTALTTNFGTGKNLLALTNSSNTGSGLASAWYDGKNIRFKISGNTYGYKPTKVEQLVSKGDYLLYPNPATTALNIHCKGNETYSITDVTGRSLLSGSFKTVKSTIDISSLPKGVYMLQITGTEKPQALKFVKG